MCMSGKLVQRSSFYTAGCWLRKAFLPPLRWDTNDETSLLLRVGRLPRLGACHRLATTVSCQQSLSGRLHIQCFVDGIVSGKLAVSERSAWPVFAVGVSAVAVCVDVKNMCDETATSRRRSFQK